MDISKRIDFFFSYWIDAWCILYIIFHRGREIKNKGCNTSIYNPKFALLFAFFMNMLVFFSMLYYVNSYNHIVIYIAIVSVVKGFPLAYLRNTKICQRDVIASFLLFGIYLLWMYWNGITMDEYMKQLYENVKYDKPVGPLSNLFMSGNETRV